MAWTRIDVSAARRQELLTRADRRCECHGHDCRHHRPTTRCTRGLRGQGWHVLRRTEGGGDALWNINAVCDSCWKVIRDE